MQVAILREVKTNAYTGWGQVGRAVAVLARFQLKHCVQFCALSFEKDIDILERVHMGEMKMIKWVRLKAIQGKVEGNIGTFNLEKRRLRGKEW